MLRVRRSNNHCDKQAINNRIEETIARNSKLQSMREAIDRLNDFVKKFKHYTFKFPMTISRLYDIFDENNYKGIDHLLNKIEFYVKKNQCSLSPDIVKSFIYAFRYPPEDIGTLEYKIVNFLDFLIKRINVTQLNDKVDGTTKGRSLVTWLIQNRRIEENNLYVIILGKLVKYYGDKIKVTAFSKKEFSDMWINLNNIEDNRIFDTILRILSRNKDLKEEIQVSVVKSSFFVQMYSPIKREKIEKILRTSRRD